MPLTELKTARKKVSKPWKKVKIPREELSKPWEELKMAWEELSKLRANQKKANFAKKSNIKKSLNRGILLCFCI